MTDLPITARKTRWPKLLMTLLLRLAALGCLWYGLVLWGQLIGYTHGGAMRFDLLGSDAQAAKALLSVLYPVAAIGLWLRGAWGVVLWSAAAAIEIFIHRVLPETFAADPVKFASIVAIVVGYVILRLIILFGKHRFGSRLTRPSQEQS